MSSDNIDEVLSKDLTFLVIKSIYLNYILYSRTRNQDRYCQ